MAIDIEGLDAAQKLALAGVFGEIVLSSGSFTDVNIADFVIPAGYRRLKFRIDNFIYSSESISGDNLYYALSVDAGSNWIYDADVGAYIDADFSKGSDNAAPSGVGGADVFGLISKVPRADDFCDIEFEINPGSAIIRASSTARSKRKWVTGNADPDIVMSFSDAMLLSPASGRANKIRLLLGGNFDMPPTADSLMSFDYTVLGVA